MTSTRGTVLALALSLLGGCSASSARRGDDGGQATAVDGSTEPYTLAEGEPTVDPPRRRRLGLEDDPPPQDDHDGFAADPHHKRAGTREGERPPRRRSVAFVPNAVEPRPVPRLQRPRVIAAARLAVAFVRSDQIVSEPDALLELDSLLADEEGIRAVTALDVPAQARDMQGLAQLAKAAKRQLLLVDMVTPERGRVGYLLHCDSGKLLARYEASGAATPVAGSGADLLTRLGQSYARLEAK